MNYYTDPDPEIIHTDPNPAPEYLYSDPRKKIKSQFFSLKLSFSINQNFLKNLPLYRVYVLDPDSYLSVRIRLLLFISGSASLNYFLLWNETLFVCRLSLQPGLLWQLLQDGQLLRERGRRRAAHLKGSNRPVDNIIFSSLPLPDRVKY